MNLWDRARNKSITTKFGVGIILLLVLMIVVSATGYLALRSVRKVDRAIMLSTEIQRLVLEMDRAMEQARHLHGQFFLEYPRIGLKKAHEIYAQPSVRQTAQAVSISKRLQEMLAGEEVSDSLRRGNIDLNLYLSSAKRFADTSIESVELVTRLATPVTGLEARLEESLVVLNKEVAGAPELRDLFHEMRQYIQKHRVGRERFLMQSAFNLSFTLRQTIQSNTSFAPLKKQRVTSLLDTIEESAGIILKVDGAIKAKFADFALQDAATMSVSATLVELAEEEVERAREEIAVTYRLALAVLFAITLSGLVAAGSIGWNLHVIITRRIVSLTASAEELRHGRLNVVDEEPPDELGKLGQTFNFMAVRIKDLVGNLEQKIAQQTEEIRESEERYRQLVEGTEDFITRIDGNGRLIFVNTAYEKVFGIKVDASGNEPAFRSVLPEDQEKARADFDACIAQKKDKALLENRQVSLDGEIHHIIWNSKFTYDRGGTVVSVDCIGRDISRLRETEAVLQREKEMVRKYLDVAGVMLAVLDTAGNIMLINQQGCKILQVKEHDAVGRNWFDQYLPERIREEVWAVFNRLMAGDLKPVEYYENAIVTTSGAERIIAFHNTLLTGKDGCIEGILFSGEDITERKNSEQEKERLEMQLRQAHKMEAIGTLAGGIAHDFNNILAAIMGYTEMAREETPKRNGVREYLDEVLKAVTRAKDLVRHILSFSRKESQQRVSVDIALIVKESLALLRASIPVTIRIVEKVDSGCGSILANPTQIHQIVMNLCTNAFHAMEEDGGVLEVGLASVSLPSEEMGESPDLRPGAYVMISVKDNGKGIDPEVREKIFDPYFTTKDVGKGSGMGLAVVSGIVLSYDGMITVDSMPGQGSTFQVYLPVIEDPVFNVSEGAGSLPTGTERILFVDDEESIVDMSRRRLEILGYQVTACTSSREALEVFRSQPNLFELVITDQTMPDLTGEKLARELLSIRPDIPIIICSGYSANFDAAKAESLGARAFIMKPMDKSELAVTIRTVLDRRIA